jgi:hypothetical protein
MKWRKVFSSEQLYRAEIVKAVLQEHEISAVIVPLKSSAYLFGHYEVHVSEEEILKALKIIENDIKFE